jgi:hypothetical protein
MHAGHAVRNRNNPTCAYAIPTGRNSSQAQLFASADYYTVRQAFILNEYNVTKVVHCQHICRYDPIVPKYPRWFYDSKFGGKGFHGAKFAQLDDTFLVVGGRASPRSSYSSHTYIMKFNPDTQLFEDTKMLNLPKAHTVVSAEAITKEQMNC